MSESYFLIETNEDGEVTLERLTRSELRKLLTPTRDDEDDGYLDAEDQKQLPDTEMDCDLAETAGWYLIKGELVAPSELDKP